MPRPGSDRGGTVRRILPIIGVVGAYQRRWVLRDALAAVTICAVLVPQALAYGQLAGLSPVDGLYAALAPLILYPLFASSRRLMVGPESGLAILTAVALAPLAAGSSSEFAVLAAMLALLTGAVLILAGLMRLGFLADFFSRPVLLGFINGVAVIIIVSQLPQFLGIKVNANSTLGTFWQVLTHLGDAQWRTIALGAGLIAVLALLAQFAPRVPGALVALVVGGVAVAVLDLAATGVAIIGAVPAGLPGVAVPHVSFGDIGTLAPYAGGLAFVGFAQSILTARAFAEQHGEALDANRELIALGVGNIGTGFLHGFPSSSSQSRTAVADTAGMRTQLAQIGAGALVVVFLLVLTGALHDVPKVALAAIIIFACLGLFQVHAMTRLYRQDRAEFAVAIITFAAVVILGMLTGILTAVFASLVLLIGRISRPQAAVLVAAHGPADFEEFAGDRRPEAAPGVVVFRFDAPLFFANADYFVDHAVEVFDQTDCSTLVLDFEAVTLIDVTAARALKRLIEHVTGGDAELSLARTSRAVFEQLTDTGLVDAIGPERFYPSVRSAVRAAQVETGTAH
ncbi:MAG: SulP family inorganic anion transporter [Solirubrobacteraceae bacterium]